ncbi:hypothetical protein P2318_08775 [Myxococcaceae bacterium GXIMD 01537]
MRIRSLPGVALLLMTSVACQKRPPLVPKAGEEPPVRLDFRPPVNRALREDVSVTRAVVQGGAKTSEESRMATVSRFVPSEGGWLLTQTVEGARLTRDGAPVATPAGAVLERLALKLRLAADGAFVEVADPEAGARALREVAPEADEALERFFAPEALEGRARQEWEAKYGGLFRRNLTVGQRSWSVGGAPLGPGAVTYLLERIVVGTEPTEHGDALVLALRCLDAVPEGAPEGLREAYAAAGAPELTPGVTCEGEQVVARALFVPVRRALTVRAKVGEAEWTLASQSKVDTLEEEAR